MTTEKTHLGEYCPGSSQHQPVYDVYTVPGHVYEIRRLWSRLDDCGADERDRIVSRLVEIGAAVKQS